MISQITMKFALIFATVIVAISALTDLEKWEQFKKIHSKTYKNILEERTRFTIFQNNLRDIEEHNNRYSNGAETYYMGVNKFADWTNEEFAKILNFRKPTYSSKQKHVIDPNFVIPDSVDWRQQGAVLEVKDQGDCGSCWAFSTTGSIEGQNAIKNNQKISLSAQDLVDCSSSYGNAGCHGGAMEYGFDYIIDNGIATEQAYPYTATDGTCKSVSKSAVKIISYVDLDSTEDALLQGVASVGPISIGISADAMQFYGGGVINAPNCTSEIDHAVLVVGYGADGSTPYWIVKNSWGADWGEKGYFRIIRNANQQCAVGRWSTYPNIA